MTRAELVNHLLRQLGVLGIGGAATSADFDFAGTVVDNAQDELEQLEVALWTVDDVPGYAIEPFVRYCAPMAAPAFGAPIDGNVKQLALAELRSLTADARHGVATANYF